MSGLGHPTGQVAAAALTLTALVAIAVKLTASGAAARSELALTFPGPPRRLGAAVEIGAHNGRYVAAAVIACVAVQLAPRTRPVLDVLLGGLLGFNAGLIGLAWGAYGTELVRALALHGSVELVAFALAGGAYLRARRRLLPARQLVLVALTAVLLVAAAAALEAYVSLEEVPS